MPEHIKNKLSTSALTSSTATQRSTTLPPIFEHISGMKVIDAGFDNTMSMLQRLRTMGQQEVLQARQSGNATGMGGFETPEEIEENAHNPGYRAVLVTDPKSGKVAGFHDFSVDPITMDMYKVYLDHEHLFPKHLQGLEREEIGFAGTVVMLEELEPGQYRRTHAAMIKEEREAGKKLILDVCFELNKGGMASHQKKGYSVLLDENGESVKVKSEYHTVTDTGKNLVLIWCDPNSDLQDKLINEFNTERRAGKFRFLDRSPFSG